MDTRICGEDFWNASVSWNTNDPVLSRCARQSILRILPFVLFWILAPIELLFRPEPRPVRWSFLSVSRISIAAFASLLQVIEFALFLSTRGVNDSPLIDLWTPGVGAATFALSVVVLLTAKSKGFVRSFSVWILTATTLFFGAFNYYHFFKDQVVNYAYEKNIGLIFLPVVSVLFIFCSIADQTKLSHLGDKPAQRECASFPSFFTFSFMNDLMYTGYKRKLTQEDLDGTREEDKTRYRGPRLWRNLVVKGEDGVDKSKGLGKALVKTFWLPLLVTGFWKLVSDGLGFVSPLLLKWLLNFISSDEPAWHGFVIVLLMLFGTLASNISQNHFLYNTMVLGLQARISLMCVVYKKAMTISNSARKEKTVGEIVNLMAVDADRFNQLMTWLHLSWAGILQIGIAIWLLYDELGYSVFAGLTVMLLVLPVNALMSRVMEKATKMQMELKDERVKTMNEILGGIKVLKLYAWEKAFIEIVLKIRQSEVSFIRTLLYVDAIFSFTFVFTPVLVALSTFAVYVLADSSHVLDPAKVFFSLSIFNILRQPLVNMPFLFSYMITSYVSLKRLNSFFASSDVHVYTTRDHDDENAVVVDSATFTWSEESSTDFQLKVNDFKVPTGSLVAVVGVVGSGKSSLLSGLLCEMQLLSGRVNISPNMQTTAYVPQQAWIQNDTLRDNILFGKGYDERKYKRILKACELLPDLTILPAGDQTEIGEKGINLSGGQKQRLSLARACYSDSDLLLFDDPLSAVDAHVAKGLFDNVFSSKTGILKDKTRVLVTNSVTVLPFVDKIYVMKDGQISESGSYDDLVGKKGDFADFLQEFGNRKEGDGEQEVRSGDRSRSHSVSTPTPGGGSGRVSRMQSQVSTLEDKSTAGDVLIEDEEMAEGSVKFSIIWKYLKSVSLFPVVIVFLVAYHVCDAGAKYWLSLWSQDKPLNGTDHVDEGLRDQRLIVYGVLGLLNAVFMLLGTLVMARGATAAAFTLHKNLLYRVMRSPMSFFETTPIGRIVNRFSKDTESVDMQLMHLWLYFFEIIMDIFSSIIMIMIALPIFIVVIIPLFVIFFFIQRFYIAASRQFKRLDSTTRSPIFSKFSETLSGISTIRAYNANDRFLKNADKSIDDNMSCSLCSVSSNRWLSIRLQFIGNLAVFFSGVFAVLNRANVDSGLIGLAIIYSMDISFLLNWFIQQISYVEVEMVAVERILEYSNNDSEADWETSEDRKLPSEWPHAGVIQFNKYSTRYRPGLDLVVQDITANIKEGEKVGIVGRTGAGKSTITLSLFRILEPASGSVVIDGVDTSQIGLHDLRGRLTIIPQDPVLFSGSLRMNLDPVNEKTDHELWRSLELSHLKDYVSSLENGLEFKVSEGGENLSVGQRQLLCLARALLRKTKILVLDEATAAVDLETDSLIQSTIRNQFSDCTILTIAHRLNTIIDSDRVIVMDGGRIREFEKPEVLLKNPDSLFHSLAVDAGITI